MKVKLRKPKPCRNEDHERTLLHWKRGKPFALSNTGVLVHRVRSATTHLGRSGEVSHWSVGYWCGNTGSSSRCELLDTPPKDRLLCTRCEAMATKAGDKPADELAGQHVHLGRLVARRVCCNKKIESN